MKSKKKFKIQICKSCVMISTRPRISFDERAYVMPANGKIQKKKYQLENKRI